jgi:hypothetical protein
MQKEKQHRREQGRRALTVHAEVIPRISGWGLLRLGFRRRYSSPFATFARPEGPTI